MSSKIFGNISLALMAVMMLAATASCDVHQWPEPNDEPQPDVPEIPGPAKTAIVKLNLKYFTDFTYRHYEYDAKTGAVNTASQTDGSSYDNLDNLTSGTPMKVTLQVHRDNSSRSHVLTQTFIKELDPDFDSDVELELATGQEYLITVWSHILDDKGEAMYDESDFNSIGLIKEKYTGSNDNRDAFRGRLKVSVPDDNLIEGQINMRRPMGKLEFVTTGLQEFLASEEKRISLNTKSVSTQDYTIVISYPAYYPSHYTAMDDRNEFASQGYSFSTKFQPGIDDADETSLGFDYVFINDTSDSAVQAQITVMHADGTQVASTGMITIPMQRDYHVMLKGAFLSATGNGGVGIDPDFDGDFNIPVH